MPKTDYAKDASLIKLMQMAIDTMYANECVCDYMSKFLNKNNWQGWKRYNKIKSKEYRKNKLGLQYWTINLFGAILEPISYTTTMPTDIKDFTSRILDFKVETYEKFNEIINEFVTRGYNEEACKVKSILSCLTKEIEKYRRFMMDGEMCKWDVPHLKIIDQILHDKLKKKMK